MSEEPVIQVLDVFGRPLPPLNKSEAEIRRDWIRRAEEERDRKIRMAVRECQAAKRFAKKATICAGGHVLISGPIIGGAHE